MMNQREKKQDTKISQIQQLKESELSNNQKFLEESKKQLTPLNEHYATN